MDFRKAEKGLRQYRQIGLNKICCLKSIIENKLAKEKVIENILNNIVIIFIVMYIFIYSYKKIKVFGAKIDINLTTL